MAPITRSSSLLVADHFPYRQMATSTSAARRCTSIWRRAARSPA